MAELVLVLGNSGTGKTYSTKTLPIEKTLFIKTTKKEIGYRHNYIPIKSSDKTGNLFVSSNVKDIITVLEHSTKNRDFEYYVFDDIQYLMSFEFFKRIKETRYYNKYVDIGKNTYDLYNFIIDKIPDDKIAFVMSHMDETIVEGRKYSKIMTIGDAVDNKLRIQGLANVILYTGVSRDLINKKVDYFFETQNSGYNDCKSPEGMFDELLIPNDLNYVAQKIKEYYPNKFKTN